jgi:hypothetical protein
MFIRHTNSLSRNGNDLDKFTDIGKDYLRLDITSDTGDALHDKLVSLFYDISDSTSLQKKYRYEEYPEYFKQGAGRHDAVHLSSITYNGVKIYVTLGYPSVLSFFINKKEEKKLQ